MVTNFKLKSSLLVALIAIGGSALSAHADGLQDALPTAKALSGNAKDNGWYNLASGPQTFVVDGETQTFAGNYNPSNPNAMSAAKAWVAPIASQTNTSSSAYFNKVANGNGSGGLSKFNADGTLKTGLTQTTWGGTGFGPYSAGESIYAISFSNAYNTKGGTLAAFDPTPVANVANVVFQVEIGSANGYDFYQPTLAGATSTGDAYTRALGTLTNIDYAPVINLTFADNSTTSIAANFSELSTRAQNGVIGMPTGPGGEIVDEAIYVNLYAFQWDLSSYSNITGFNITFDVVEHSQTYATRLTQSDVFNQVVAVAAVPEPETYALLMAGLGLVGFAARRRKTA